MACGFQPIKKRWIFGDRLLCDNACIGHEVTDGSEHRSFCGMISALAKARTVAMRHSISPSATVTFQPRNFRGSK